MPPPPVPAKPPRRSVTAASATAALLLLVAAAVWAGGASGQLQPTGSSVHWQVCTDNQCGSCIGNETVIGCFPKPQDNSSSQYDCVDADKYVQISEYYANPRCGGSPSFTPLIPTGQCAAAADGSGLYYRYTCQAEPQCTIRGVDWSGTRTITWRKGVDIPNEHDYFWTLNFCENVTSTCTERPAYLQQVDATDGFCCKMFMRRNGVTASSKGRVEWHLEDPFDNNPSQATVVVLCDPTTGGQIRPSPDIVKVSKTAEWTVFNLTVYSSLACAYGNGNGGISLLNTGGN